MDLPGDDVPLRLVFRGECLEDHDPQSVREALARVLKLDEPRTQRLFSGKPIVLRRQMEPLAAYRAIVRFAQLGARVYAEPANPPPAGAPAPAGAAPPVHAPAGAAQPVHAPAGAAQPVHLPAAAAQPVHPPATVRAAVAAARARFRPPMPVAAQASSASPGSQAWTPLQWVAAGVLVPCAAILIGLVLGPGLSTLWPHPAGAGGPAAALGGPGAPRMAMVTPTAPLLAPDGQVVGQPQIAAPADAPANVPANVPPLAPANVPAKAPANVPTYTSAQGAADPSTQPDAQQEYLGRYQAAPRHKAFAISTRGVHAWHGQAASQNEARDRALAGCMAAIQPGDQGCRIVDVDGEWQE